MPIDEKELNEYMVGLANAAGIAEADRPTFLAKDEVKKFAHSSLEAVEREKGRANKATTEAARVYEENLKIYANNKSAVEQAQAEVAKYEAKFGKLDPAAHAEAIKQVTADVLDKKTFEERIGKSEANTIGLVKIASKITASHLKEFNDVPDFDAIEKIATEQGLTAEKAYTEYVRPKRDEREKASQAEALKKAREEGEIEGRSKVAASAISDPERSSPFMSNLRKGGEVKEGPKESFVKGWREAAQKTGTA